MAAKKGHSKGKKKAAHKGKKKAPSKKKGHKKGGHIPLKVLEKRLARLASVVAKRGGHKASKVALLA